MSKKVYDRDFLIRLQFIDLSKQKPKDLPNFAEIVMSEPNSSSRDFKSIRHGKDFDFNPHYFKPSGVSRTALVCVERDFIFPVEVDIGEYITRSYILINMLN